MSKKGNTSDSNDGNSSDDEVNILMPKYSGKEDEKEEKKLANVGKGKKGKKGKKAKKGGAGIGYSTNVGKTWDVNAYLKDKEAKNQQIIKMIEVMQMLADSCSDISPPSDDPKATTTKRLLNDEDE